MVYKLVKYFIPVFIFKIKKSRAKNNLIVNYTQFEHNDSQRTRKILRTL